MLDVKYSWEVFQTFEKMFFNPENGDFFQFMDNWNNRLQDAIKAGLEYPNNILAFKIISCSNLSAHAQSQVIAALQKEYRDNCNILHLTMHLLNKETALAQEYNSDPLEDDSIIIEEETILFEDFNQVGEYKATCEEDEDVYCLDDDVVEVEDDDQISCLNEKDNLEEKGELISSHKGVSKTSDVWTNKNLKCFVCKKSFQSAYRLTRHMKIHTGEKPHSCSYCGKSFGERDKLSRHLRTHLDAEDHYFKVHVCDVCDKTFARQDKLQRHLITHTEEKVYSCSICDKTFARHDKLSRHMITHTEEKRYSCSICDKKFARHDKLSRHMITHTEEKSYSCSICNKTFARKDRLSRHMNIHTEEKSICDNPFVRHEKLSKHINILTKSNCQVLFKCVFSYSKNDKKYSVYV